MEGKSAGNGVENPSGLFIKRNTLEDLIGKRAYKLYGFFEGKEGTIQRSRFQPSEFIIKFDDDNGSVAFSRVSDVKLVGEED